MPSFAINGVSQAPQWSWVIDPAAWRCNATMPSGTPADPNGQRRQAITHVSVSIAGYDGSKTYSVFVANSDGGDRKTSSNYTVGYATVPSLQAARRITTKKVTAGQTIRVGFNQVTSPIVVGRGSKSGINIVSESPSGYGWPNYSLVARVYYATLPTAPSAPSLTGSTDTPGVLVASWNAPSNDGGSGIEKYRLEYSKQDDFENSTTVTIEGGRVATISDLDEGDEYHFRVAAVNGVGNIWGTSSAWSSTNSAVAPGTPAKAAKAGFRAAAGSYVGRVTVAVTTSTPGATIYYTTNGATPTTGSSVYSTPLTFTTTTTLKTLVVAGGYSNSDVTTGVYTIVNGYVSNGSTWDNLVRVQVSDGTEWTDVAVQVSNGTTWVNPV